MTEDMDKERLSHQIDENLKKVFQRTLDEEVPDKFMDLLSKLRESEEKSAKDPAHGK